MGDRGDGGWRRSPKAWAMGPQNSARVWLLDQGSFSRHKHRCFLSLPTSPCLTFTAVLCLSSTPTFSHWWATFRAAQVPAALRPWPQDTQMELLWRAQWGSIEMTFPQVVTHRELQSEGHGSHNALLPQNCPPEGSEVEKDRTTWIDARSYVALLLWHWKSFLPLISHLSQPPGPWRHELILSALRQGSSVHFS